jgi:hypothetical protein
MSKIPPKFQILMTRPLHPVSHRLQGKRGGAAEARRAHNPEVQGSKPCLAKKFFLLFVLWILFTLVCEESKVQKEIDF